MLMGLSTRESGTMTSAMGEDCSEWVRSRVMTPYTVPYYCVGVVA